MAKKTPKTEAVTPPTSSDTTAARGRPPGAENIKIEAIVVLSRCPSCKSTERTEYTNRTELEHGGMHDGQPFTHIVWQSTRCENCGQARRDKSYENRSETIG